MKNPIACFHLSCGADIGLYTADETGLNRHSAYVTIEDRSIFAVGREKQNANVFTNYGYLDWRSDTASGFRKIGMFIEDSRETAAMLRTIANYIDEHFDKWEEE